MCRASSHLFSSLPTACPPASTPLPIFERRPCSAPCRDQNSPCASPPLCLLRRAVCDDAPAACSRQADYVHQPAHSSAKLHWPRLHGANSTRRTVLCSSVLLLCEEEGITHTAGTSSILRSLQTFCFLSPHCPCEQIEHVQQIKAVMSESLIWEHTLASAPGSTKPEQQLLLRMPDAAGKSGADAAAVQQRFFACLQRLAADARKV